MRQSRLFSKTRREAPKDETSRNAEFLIRAGYIQKMQAGVYAYLPLGLRVIDNLVGIIRKEINAVGGQEVSMATLQDKSVWMRSGRWDDGIMDNWFKTKLKNDTEVGLASTHEEPLTDLLRDHIRSFRDLPAYIYQFQTKFRNEKRAKSGIMRGREFLMKDLYSFSRTEAEHSTFYEKMKTVYANIFKEAGIGDRTFITFASGGSFSQFSHEFQTLTEAGEDVIYIDRKKGMAVNKEVYTDEVLAQLGVSKGDLEEEKAVEVGNIFSLGTRFSEPLELVYKDEQGRNMPVIMGSYGIGVPRLMGAIVECLADSKGLVWPKNVAPFAVHLVLVVGSNASLARAEELYKKLDARAPDSTLFDDRDSRAGEKFADADLIGIPLRVVVSDKNPEKDGKPALEVTVRATGETKILSEEELVKML